MINKYGIQIQETCCSCTYRKLSDGIRTCGIDKQVHNSSDTCKRWAARPCYLQSAGNGAGRELQKMDIDRYYKMCAERNEKRKKDYQQAIKK